MRRLPYARHRTDHRRCECPHPHVSFYHARGKPAIQNPERLHNLSQGPDERLGHEAPGKLAKFLIVANGPIGYLFYSAMLMWTIGPGGSAELPASSRQKLFLRDVAALACAESSDG